VSRAALCSADDNHGFVLHTGMISLSEWCTAMEEQTRLGIPWRMLREKLVTLDPSSGKVEYHSTFQEHTNGRRSVWDRMLQAFFYRISLSCILNINPVGIATGYGLDDRGVWVRVPVDSWSFSPPNRPDRLCGPPSLLSSGYERLFPGLGVTLTSQLQLVPRSRKLGSIYPLPHTPSWGSA
jgi:hypothetical protein